MKNKTDPKEWSKDFDLFLNAPEVTPPQHVSTSVLEYVRRELNPSIWMILSKLGIVHVAVGSLSLLLCVQFGMGRGYSLMHVFMSYGELACMALCGALFLGLTALIASCILSNSELRGIRKFRYSPILVLGLVSLIVFFCFGAHIALNFAVAWLFGGLVAGIAITEVGIGVRVLVQRVA